MNKKQVKKSKRAKKLPIGVKKIGKYTGVTLPLPTFPKNNEKFLQQRIIEIAKLISNENKEMVNHEKDNYDNPADMWGHLFNTNLAIDRLLYLIIWLFHLESHDERGLEEFSKIRKTVLKVDEEFRHHAPKLQYIDQQVESHLEREKRAKSVYG